MGRKNRRQPDPPESDRGPGAYGPQGTEEHADGEWVVRRVTGAGATKTYRCPGCDQEIRPATPHVVAFPADDYGNVEDRRHWHTPCWQARGRRGPRTQKSSRGPRY
jgi:hypothetical protein